MNEFTIEQAQADYDQALAYYEHTKVVLAGEATRANTAAAQQAHELAQGAYERLMTFYAPAGAAHDVIASVPTSAQAQEVAPQPAAEVSDAFVPASIAQHLEPAAAAPIAAAPAEAPSVAVPAAAAPAVAAPAVADPPVVLGKRPSVNRFVPPPAAEPAVPLVRDLLARKSNKPLISRERKVAGSLPAWNPLPPGEVLTRPDRS